MLRAHSLLRHLPSLPAHSSSMVASTYSGMERDFGVSREVATLSLSLWVTCGCGGDSAASVQLIRGCLSSSSRFIAGLGIGPLALAPLSEFYGRAPIYIIGYFLYGCFSFLVAFGNFGGVLAGRAIQGLAGSAFLSVAGGSVSDLWIGQQVGPPMALYSAFPFIGPVLGELHVPQIQRGEALTPMLWTGPIMSSFINQALHWRWTWYILTIWIFAELALLIVGRRVLRRNVHLARR